MFDIWVCYINCRYTDEVWADKYMSSEEKAKEWLLGRESDSNPDYHCYIDKVVVE